MDTFSTPISTSHARIRFGATPHDKNQLGTILEWVGTTGMIVDLRVAKERVLSESTPFQYHNNLEQNVRYSHFPITDRSVPTKKVALAFGQLVRTITEDTGRVYIHCRGGHGRSGLVAACILVQLGEAPTTALATVRTMHANRPELSKRMRELGAPQNDKQREFVLMYGDDGTGPVHFYDERQSVFSNLWGTKGTFKQKTLGGEHHLDGLQTPFAPHLRWRTVEHFFQAHKFLWDTSLPGATSDIIQAGREYAALIASAMTGATVFRLGNIGHTDRRKWFKTGYEAHNRIDPSMEDSPLINDKLCEYVGRVRIRPDWDSFRNVVMEKALRVKFHTGGPRAQLMATGDRSIHEHTKRDLYWGDGMEDANGQDMLGNRLQSIRLANRTIDVEG